MRYTFFEFTNFKGIRQARLEMSPDGSAARIYTLVGLNESGKTTVLEAIDQFQAADEEISPKQLGGWVPPNPHSLIPIGARTNFNGTISIRCGVELDEEDVQAARMHLRHVADGYRLVDLARTITIADCYEYQNSRFDRRHTVWSGLSGTGYTKKGRIARDLTSRADSARWQALARFLRSRLPPIWFFPNFLFDFPERIYLEASASESVANRFYRALFQDVLSAVDSDLNIAEHIIDRVRSGRGSDIENLQQLLLDAGRHVTQTVFSAWNRIFVDRPLSQKAVRIEHGEEETDATKDDGSPLPPRIWIRFRIEDSEGLFSVRDRSLGFRWFFVYLMLTTYRGRRRALAGDMLFLFDEPASNLHPTAQSALLASLESLSREAVVIYTTHSHHLIDPRWLNTTYVVNNTSLDAEAVSVDFTAQTTDIHVTPYRQFAAAHPSQAHFFQPILDVLDYAPSRLEMVPSVVMVEGKTDYYLLTYFEEVVLGMKGNQRLHFLPGGGAGSLDNPIRLYLGWARPFIVLLDSDREGRAQRDRYISKFGEILRPRLMVLSEASGVSSAKGVESLLTSSDRIAFQSVADASATTYRKKMFARGVQEALSARHAVELCESMDALSAIRARLMERLGGTREF